MSKKIAEIPPRWRILVTSHDAFGYFGARYGLEVLAVQGMSTESEASLRDINALIEKISQRQIPAVFVESSVSPKTVESLVDGVRRRGRSLRIGGELLSDALGARGTPQESYVGMLEHNVDVITKGLQAE